MAATEEFNIPVPFIENPDEQGTNRTYLGNPLLQVDITGFTYTVTEQYVLHGQCSKEANTPASLVVVHFNLHRDSSVEHRRFRKVTIALTFTSTSDEPADDPVIRCFAPAQEGEIGVIPTTVLRQKEQHGNVSAEAKADPIPIGLGFLYGWKDNSEWQQHLLATVSAKPGVSSFAREREGHNVVEWTINENGCERRLPDSYQFAVLIERSNDQPFTVKAKVDASVDALYAVAGTTKSLKSLIGLRQPVKTYDPAKKAEVGKLGYPEDAKIDSAELGLLINGRELDKYSYVHVVEQVTPLSIYGGTQPVASSESGGRHVSKR
jgi:hypothetical protein